MRFASFSTVSLFAVVAASGCAGARWTVNDTRPVLALTVAPADVQGMANPKVVALERVALINELRAHGYVIVDEDAAGTPGVARVALSFHGTEVSDAQMHAPDDSRHHIYNDLRYSFVAYKVKLDVTAADGRVVASGTGEANGDPSAVMKGLTHRLVTDVPALRPRAFATR
ncbi:MAG: hypothetical protein JWN44_2344 [Myxococcales bacterium]|nr:hypothetical protein [Myxococcales bacterium]